MHDEPKAFGGAGPMWRILGKGQGGLRCSSQDSKRSCDDGLLGCFDGCLNGRLESGKAEERDKRWQCQSRMEQP